MSTEQLTTPKNLLMKMVTTRTKSKVTGDKQNANFLNLELENIFFLHILQNFCGDICIETRICLLYF